MMARAAIIFAPDPENEWNHLSAINRE